MRQAMPIRHLAAEIERQPTDAEIRERIRDDHPHLSSPIDLPGTKCSADSGIASADHEQPNGISERVEAQPRHASTPWRSGPVERMLRHLLAEMSSFPVILTVPGATAGAVLYGDVIALRSR